MTTDRQRQTRTWAAVVVNETFNDLFKMRKIIAEGIFMNSKTDYKSGKIEQI